ncbi:hypothetical protein ES702_03921 [subsurface metagenome]
MTDYICQFKEKDRGVTIDYCNNVCKDAGVSCKNLWYLCKLPEDNS